MKHDNTDNAATRLWDTSQVADYFQVATSTIERWTLLGHIKTVPMPGRLRRYDPEYIRGLKDEWAKNPPKRGTGS